MNLILNNITNKIIKYIITFVSTIIVVYYINLKTGGGKNTFIYSVFGIIIYLIILFFINKYFMLKKRIKRFCYCFSLAFSLLFIFGASISYTGNAAEGFIKLLFLIFSSFAVAFPVAGGLGMISGYIYKYCLKSTPIKTNITNGKFFIISFIIIILCWLPVFLAFFPSIFTYDCDYQLKLYFSDNTDNLQPIIHTLMLAFFYNIGDWLFSSPTLGIMLYSITQMVVMAGIFSYVLTYMYKIKASSVILILSILFYAVIPINSMLVLSATKDTIFSGLVLLITVLWFERKNKENNKLKMVIFGALWVIMISFRNNAIYAVIITIIILLISKINVIMKKKLAIFFGSVVIAYFASYSILMNITNARDVTFIHKYSVPLQQMARVMNLKADEIPIEQAFYIFDYIPPQSAERYHGAWADPIKFSVNARNIKNNKMGFFIEWLKLGIKYPGIYVDAFLDLNRGNYFIDDVSHSEIYRESEPKERRGYLLTQFMNYDRVEEISYFQSLKDEMIYWFSDNHYQDIPVISIIFSPALYVWLIFAYCAVMLYIKKYRMIIPAIFLLTYFFTVMFGPTCLVRYVYFIIVCVPFLAAVLFNEVKDYS